MRDGGHWERTSRAGLPTSIRVSLCAQEADLGPEVAKEVELAAGPGVETEAEVQPLPTVTSLRRDSAGAEVAVLTSDLTPIVDQQQVLAR